MSGRRFSAKLAARLIGVPIPDHGETEPGEANESPLPQWLAELDTYEGAEELSLPPDSDIEDMLRARIAGPRPQEEAGAKTPAPRGSDLPVTGTAHDRAARRQQCPKTTP